MPPYRFLIPIVNPFVVVRVFILTHWSVPAIRLLLFSLENSASIKAPGGLRILVEAEER
jgi:hypothetical protein